MSNWEPNSQHIWPNWKLKTGPQLIVRIAAAHRAHFPPLTMRARGRIIPRAPRSTQRALRSLSCASLAVHRAHLRRYPALAHIALRNLRTVRCVYLHLNRDKPKKQRFSTCFYTFGAQIHQFVPCNSFWD